MDFDYPWQFRGRRSAVMARGGMVATSHPLAAQAGLGFLREGGTAADAAVATAAVLNVVEPNMTGIGGDAFALTHFDDTYAALNASGPAPADATIEAYRGRVDDDPEPASIPVTGGLPVTVPGALDGWQRLLDRYGRFELGELLEPAIDLAAGGFPVTEFVARQWAHAADRLREVDAAEALFLPDGSPPAPGDLFANPALAETFELIADEGIEVLYGGELGEAVVEAVRDHDGPLDLADLEAFSAEWVEPIETSYRGVDVLEHPPNGQGLVALEALNLVEPFELATEPTAAGRIHTLIEAIKLAFADGYEHIADPAVVDVPTERLLSKDYARERAAEIGARAGTYAASAADTADTVYLSVVDGDGNAVSFINSLYRNFGSCVTVRGFALQNRGHSFSLDAGHANALEPGKRPYHTIIPAMLREDGRFRASMGVMGGSMQPQGHLQVVAALVDSGLNPQAALDVPRFRWLEGRRVALETGRLPEATVSELRQRGHRIVDEDAFFESGGHWGGGQVVYRSDDGRLVGGSDPRKDGQVAAF